MSQQINLYNPVFLKQKHYFSAITMLQALAAVLAGAIGMYLFEVRQNRTLEAALAEAEARVVAQREQTARFGREFSDQGASRALSDDLTRAEERLRQRQALLGELTTGVGGDVAGFSRYLGALARQRTSGVWLTGVEIGARKEGEVVIRGRALESRMVPPYIRSLDREPVFSGRAVGELRMSAKNEMRQESASAKASTEPARYIEFTLAIPTRDASGAPAPKGGG